jgi:hypothetical protein
MSAGQLLPGRLRSPIPALVATVVASLVAGCATVPTAGPIEQGPVVDSVESTQFIRVIAAPPSRDASPAEIVRGFLEASASLEQDHAIARRYLTEEASEQWDPGARTAVYEESSLEVRARGDRVRVDVEISGELLPDGTLVSLSPAEPLSLVVTLAQVPEEGADDPQWRIVDPPEGILISAADLRRAYRPYGTYFPSARSSVLVPDGRLIPVVGPSLPTTLAELVLAGPARWLAPAVRPVAPEGTGLALGAVPVTDGVAQVELTEEALSATDSQRRDLAAGLTWTLTQLPEIAAVELLASGEAYEVPGVPPQMSRESWGTRAPDALSRASSGQAAPPHFLLDGETIVRVTQASRTSIPLPDDVPGDLVGLAVGLDQRRAAAVDPQGGSIWLLPLDRSTTAQQVEVAEPGDMSFDVDGRLWVADGRHVRRVGAGGRVEKVELRSGLGEITALQLARDGSRIALVADGSVLVGVVVEDDDGPAITSLRRVETVIEDARALAWRDASTLDVLGALAGGGVQVLRLAVGSGRVLPLGTPARPRELAAAPAGLTLVGTGPGGVFANVGLQWRDQGSGRSVAYPG